VKLIETARESYASLGVLLGKFKIW